jgi:hypothetical protein
VYLNNVLEIVHVLCTSGLYPQPSTAMARNAPQLNGACKFILSGDVRFKDAYNDLREILENNRGFFIPEYIKRPIFKTSKRGGSIIHIFLLWSFLHSSQQHINVSNTDFGQLYFFQDGNLTSQRLNTKYPFDSLYITHGQLDDTKFTKISNLSDL